MKHLLAVLLLSLPAIAQTPKIEASDNPFTDMTPQIPQCAGGCDEGEVFDIYCWIGKKQAKAAEIQACIDAAEATWAGEQWVYCALWDEWAQDFLLCELLTPGQCGWIVQEMDILSGALQQFTNDLEDALDAEIDKKLDGFCADVQDMCCVQGWPGWPIVSTVPNLVWAL
jgi:hypothetical protein